MNKISRLAMLSTAIGRIVPFDGDKKPGWKLNEAGDAVLLKDGNPIYVQADGSEAVIQSDTIAQRNAEAKAQRERAEAAETKLKAFEGIDATKAKEALETVSKLDQKKLIDAGEVDRVKEQIKGEFSAQLEAEKTEKDKLRADLNNLTLTTAFQGSKYIGDKLAIPTDIVQSVFARNFEVGADGKIIAKGSDGNQILSKQKIGEPADFDEALSIIVDNYPNKAAILKGGNHAGSGNSGGGGSGTPGQARYTRSEFEKLDPNKQATIMADARAGKAEVVDG